MLQPSSREDEGQNINKFKPKIQKPKDKGVESSKSSASASKSSLRVINTVQHKSEKD